MQKQEKKIGVSVIQCTDRDGLEIPEGIRISESESGKEIDLTWEEAKELITQIAVRLPPISDKRLSA